MQARQSRIQPLAFAGIHPARNIGYGEAELVFESAGGGTKVSSITIGIALARMKASGSGAGLKQTGTQGRRETMRCPRKAHALRVAVHIHV
jgi:hypothetical protein